MNSRWAVAGAGLGVVLGLLLFAPAAWLASAVAAGTDARVQLADARGSVWRGNARLVVSGGVGSLDAQALPGRLAWELGPSLQGLRLRLSADCCIQAPLEMTLVPGWRSFGLRVANGASQWPAALLAGFGAPWNTVQLEGLLRVSSEGLSVEWVGGRMQVVGVAQLEALGMSSKLATLKPIGSYRLRLSAGAGQGPPVLQLQTLEGSLALSGSGAWDGARWRFRGEASAAPESEQALGNLLNMVGRREGARSAISLG